MKKNLGAKSIRNRYRSWILEYFDGMKRDGSFERAMKYFGTWFLIYFFIQVIGGSRNGLSDEDSLIFFGAFVGVPFLTYFGGAFYFAWKDRDKYRDEEGFLRYRKNDERVRRFK